MSLNSTVYIMHNIITLTLTLIDQIGPIGDGSSGVSSDPTSDPSRGQREEKVIGKYDRYEWLGLGIGLELGLVLGLGLGLGMNYLSCP
jgi:hypothetical protein